MKSKTNKGLKIICLNRKASFNYFFNEILEAGIVLKGSEIKSIRKGKVNISDSYAVDKGGEIVLINSHISSYKESSYNDHYPTNDRKLLLNKREVNKLIGKINREGFTIVPTKMYFKRGKVKVEIAVAKGKKQYDKRQVKKQRDWNREKSRYFRKTSWFKMIFLGLGSNLPSKYGDRFTNINLAISSLEGYGIKVIKKSSFYETPSYPNKENPKFINAVILVETILPPIDLMSVLIFIEEKLERKRGKKNDPRTCDIDIIDYNSQILNLRYNNLDLTVPHKELTLRNFILFPLQEISPTWEHPKTKEIISVLLQKLNDEDKNSILKIVKNW